MQGKGVLRNRDSFLSVKGLKELYENQHCIDIQNSYCGIGSDSLPKQAVFTGKR